MEKILVTGASGLVGSYLITLLTDKYKVYGISRTSPDYINDNYSHINIDISESKNYDLLPEKVDYIIHLSQSEDFRNFPDLAKKIFEVNSLSTLLLLDYARKISVKSFILASSGGVYGYGDIPFKENSQIQKNNELGFYLSTKICSEIIADNYTNFMNIITLRPFFIYGIQQNKSMLIPRLIESVFNNLPLKLQGKEGIKINPINVIDAAKAIEQSLKINKSVKINLAGSEIVSIKDIGNIISEILKKKVEFEIDNSVPKSIMGDITLMKEVLIKPEVSLENGISQICKGYL